MDTMILFPSIDLHGGRCLRLGQETDDKTFEGDPVEIARHWRATGVEWLHVVDLDGALAGEPKHLDTLHAIAEASGLPIQMGGGLRSEASVEAAFAAGAERVILGTAALRNPELLAICLNRWGRRIAVSVDSRGGQVVVAGWLESVSESATDFAKHMAEAGVQTLVMTNVERDGSLPGLDMASLDAARKAIPTTQLLAGGGIASLEDVRALARTGLNGVVLGRVLYSGSLDIADAMSAAREAAGGPQEQDAAAPSTDAT